MTVVERAVAALRAGGVPVKEFPGWRDRAHSGAFTPVGILFHHDASQVGPSDTRDWMWVNGELAPACHFWVDYDGNWWVGSNGLAWHGGAGGGWGVIPAGAANQYAFGVETDHTVNEPWPKKQYDSIVAGFALIAREFGMDPRNSVCGHKEYAPDRKIDPDGVDLNGFRAQVANWNQAKQKKEWPDVAISDEDKKWITQAIREGTNQQTWYVERRLRKTETLAHDQGVGLAKAISGVDGVDLAELNAALEKTNVHLDSVAQDLGARVDTLAADLKPNPGA